MLSFPRRVSLRRTAFRAFAGLAIGVGLLPGAVVAFGYGGPASAASEPVAVMKDPVKIWSEDFSGSGPAAVALPSYTSARGTSYTANPYWLDQSLCNGIVLSYNSGSTPACPEDSGGGGGSQQNLQRLADSLGQYRLGVPGTANPAAPMNGSTAGIDAFTASRANRVLGEVTRPSSARPANQIELRTATNVPLPEANRFLALSIDVADVSCAAPGGSKLAVSFIDQAGTEVPTGSPPYSVCDDPGRRFFTSPLPSGAPVWVFGGNSVAVGTMKRTKPVLIHGNQTGILIRNQAPEASGDDHALDNLSIYDLTPTLTQTLVSGTGPAGVTTELRMTVTNTSDLEAKPGWSFTNTLPQGFTLADAAPISTTCAHGAGTPAADGASFTIAGDLLPGQSACTVTVSVTSAGPVSGRPAPKSLANCPANFEAILGHNAPTCASVPFLGKPALSPQVIVTKSADPASGSPVNVGQGLAYSLTVKNNGANVAHIDRVDDIRGVLDDATLTQAPDASDPAWKVGPLQDGTIPIRGSLAPGQAVTIRYAAKVKPDGSRGDNVLVSRLLTSGTALNSTPDKSCPPRAEACVQNPVSSWSVTLTADKAAAVPGDTVRYTATQTNTGALAIQDPVPVTIDLDETLDDAHYDGDAPATADYNSPRLSWSTALAAGEQRTITYTMAVKLSAGVNHRLHSVVLGGTNCQPGSPAPECSTDTIVRASAVTGSGPQVALSPDPVGLPAVTTGAARTPNRALLLGGLAALTAGMVGNLSRVRSRHRRHAERNPGGRGTEL